MAQLLAGVWCLLVVVAAFANAHKAPQPEAPSRADFLDGLVDRLLEQSRDLLGKEAPRIARQVSTTEPANWSQQTAALQVHEQAAATDDRHIQYDATPLPASSTGSPPAEHKAGGSGAATGGELSAASTPAEPEAADRNSMARSIHEASLARSQQQLTRPPYATGDQFQMRTSLLNAPSRGDADREKLHSDDAAHLMDSLERPHYDQLFSTAFPPAAASTASAASPSRAHNDRYTDEFQNILSTEQLHSVQQAIQGQLLQQPEAPQADARHVNNFAASFVNITAPLNKPMSASEAMKLEIAGAGSKKSAFMQQQQQHQTNGFMRPPSTPEPNRNLQSAPHFYVGQYGAGGSESAPTSSIYSAPANQFPVLEAPMVQQQQQQPAPVNSQDKERMRLDAHQSHFAQLAGSLLTGRRPHYGAGSHLPSMTVQQASGFRSPLGWHQTLQTDGYSTNSAMLSVSPANIMNATYPQTRTPPSMAPLAAAAAAAAVAAPTVAPPGSMINNNSTSTITTNGFITSSANGQQQQQQQLIEPPESMQPNPTRRLYNLTRVEHISAECSNDLIRTLIVFNGTFKGIIYSSGYVRDPNCMYINGTGKTRYDFSIRLNQCGTLSRQEVHAPSATSDISRQDKVMWNTLSIQYNPIIEQEWDEHFRVSCEYGSDFWKTISFNPFNVETNTGSPVVFTVDPPQCQMEVLRGYGVMGPRQEAVSGPVTVGDPLTLLIHMKSEKAGYDILVKNCIAHNGGTQKMQLIDSNGCVVNERFISPFRGNYNDNELKHVTLYSFLKAFRFTGSPVLYLECEIHMCHNKCPPQMCYWRRLSKRSVGASNETSYFPETGNYTQQQQQLLGSRRSGRHLKADATAKANQMSDKVSLFQALEVRHDVPGRGGDPDAAAYRSSPGTHELDLKEEPLLCYRRAHLLAFFLGAGSIVLVAIVVATCCWRATSARMARNIVARQLHHNGMFIGTGIAVNHGSQASSDFRPMGTQQQANLLNASYQKALNSINPTRHQIATSHRERLLAAAAIH